MKTECPRCNERLDIDDANAGLNVTCPTCEHEFECPKQKEVKFDHIESIAKPKNEPSLTEKKLKEIALILYVGIIALPLLAGAFNFFSVLPKRYEYTITATPDTQLLLELKVMGNEGWEMVSARRAALDGDLDSMAYEMIWKRLK